MNSGSIVPVDTVDCPKGQGVYDTVVKNAGCASASDTLECLRGVDYTACLNAANSVPEFLGYNSAALFYLPRPDGTALTDSPEVLVEQGKYAKVPFIVGDQEDEGTICRPEIRLYYPPCFSYIPPPCTCIYFMYI